MEELEIPGSCGKIKFLHRQVPYVLAKSVVLSHRRKACAALCGGLCVLLQRARAADCRGCEVATPADESGISHQKHLMMSEHGIEIEEV